MSDAPTIRVAMVDDHPVVTEGLALVLARFSDIDVVAAASGGAEAVEVVAATRPDVVLMDLSMPEVDGVEATRRILASNPDVRVVALTAFMEHDLVHDVMAAGAAGYLLKSAEGSELVSAIRAAATGASILSGDALSLFMTKRDNVGADLTPRERDVLHFVAHGLANKQIATELGLTTGTVRIHVSNILAKLNVENRTAAASLALEAGLVDRDRSARNES